MFQCKSGKHWWFNQDDADKCCNGWKRTLSFEGGDNRQTCGGAIIGRQWIKTDSKRKK